MTLWRIVKEKHVASAFNGEGARLFGGRWNLRGSAVVYVSGSLALAALEPFVHLSSRDVRLSLVAIAVDVPDDIGVTELTIAQLPPNWREEPPPDETKALGSAWFQAQHTLLLKVPSMIVPIEANYVMNPRHPDFSRLMIKAPQPFGFDKRMWK